LYIGSMDSNVYAFGSPAQSDLGIPITYLIVAVALILVIVVAVLIIRKQKIKV